MAAVEACLKLAQAGLFVSDREHFTFGLGVAGVEAFLKLAQAGLPDSVP